MAEQRISKVSLPMEVYRNYEFCGELKKMRDKD
jgi:hypothetical protein